MSINNTNGWTLIDWQHAYRAEEIQLNDLSTWIEQLDPNDPAWISIASTDDINQQIQELTQRSQQFSSPSQHFPLYGIPFAVKDNIDVSGFATTAAYAPRTAIAQQDAEVVQRLKAAGAIVVGKTNLDQFATGLVGTRSPFGIVPNSFNSDYVSGGSSSGSASVVARGLVPFSLGTDTAGSGRVPAAFNNIVGLKPTKGRLSNHGVFPACKSIDCVSIFALSVVDAALVAEVVAGYDAKDSYSRADPATAPARFSAQLKFAVPEQLEFFGDVQAEAAFSQALQQMQALGAEIVPIDFSAFDQLAAQLYQGSWVAERTVAVQAYLDDTTQDFDPTVLQIIQQGQSYSAVDAYQDEYLKQDLSRQIEASLAGFDALIVPTSPTIHRIADMATHPIEYNAHFGRYTNFTNLADLSALALPAGFRADGLPFGVSLIAPAWHDSALLHFGQIWQQALDLKLGATQRKLPSADQTVAVSKQHVRVAVVGAHLTGMPLNFQLTTRQAVLVETTTTSADYALYALSGTQPPKPGLARVSEQGQSIIVELWDVPMARFGEFVAEVPTPLGIGNVELADGRWVKSFICEAYALTQATDIRHFGGWRAYIQSQNHPSQNDSSNQAHTDQNATTTTALAEAKHV